MDGNISDKIKLHKQYWDGTEMKRPLVGFRIGDFFFSRHFNASRKLLVPGTEIKAHMVDVDDFLDDYIRVSVEIERIEQDAFWTAEPFTGFPWMEAICGCRVYASEHSFVSHPCLTTPDEFKKVVYDPDNPWYKKYIEFIQKLGIVFKDRNPIGQPIMRGVSDVLGALLGQEEMVYAIYDFPKETADLLERITEIFICIINDQYKFNKPFYDGYSIGFYHLWCPGNCIWFQEDLTSILSPRIYDHMIRPLHELICSQCNYSAIHLHSSSFHILERILGIKYLKAVEINKDIGGLRIVEMIPIMKKVQDSGKKLIVWGELDKEDISTLIQFLAPSGLYFNIVVPTVESAMEIMELITPRDWSEKAAGMYDVSSVQVNP